ncbi:MAG: hypothetical protein ATN34_05525 [Epulopiscium sp. Nele67-Bin002]|nr:MAG: hypothetical protein ATN34_05525 [Epulopiscium sp. Nele67-Bin002]
MSEKYRKLRARLEYRIAVFELIYLIIMGIFGLRALYLYYFKSTQYELAVLRTIVSKDAFIDPLRGDIVDKNDKTIATSQLSYNVILNPKTLLNDTTKERREETYIQLSRYMNMDIIEIADWVNASPQLSYRIFRKNISVAQYEELSQLKLAGVYFEQTFVRSYPRGEFAAQVIGFYNANNQGQYGVEQYYNNYLVGEAGRVFTSLQSGDLLLTQSTAPINGGTVILTIDEIIQQVVESEMKSYVEEANPVNAAAIVMNPNTGEVYAMYSYPTFNPATYSDLSQQMGDEWLQMANEEKTQMLYEAWKNFNTQKPYEPGSTFKPLMVATAIDAGYLDVDKFQVDCPGYRVVAGETIRCWKTTGHGVQNAQQVLANSCNPGVIAIAEQIPNDVFYNAMLAYGLSQPTGIDLTGEVGGIIHSLNSLGPVEKATSSMGQTFTMTTVQLMAGFSALINGGYVVEPYVVSKVIGDSNLVLYERLPNIKRQVISNETSALMAGYLESVVLEGTGGSATVAGYRVAGKTGTAEKGYPRESGVEILSFVGYAPISNPEVIAIVLMDEGQEVVGGPGKAFSSIMTHVLPYLGIKGDLMEQAMMIKVPNFAGQDIYTAIENISLSSLEYILRGGGQLVVGQYPPANTMLPMASKITLYLESDTPTDLVKVPNLIDLTTQKARDLVSGELEIEAQAEGQIVNQIPDEGAYLDRGAKVIVETIE